MTKQSHALLKWYLDTAQRFFSMMPKSSITIVFFSLIARFSGMLSMLLPIKVILLLGSNRTPRYFPDFLKDVDRDILVITLSISAVVMYLINMGAEKLVSYIANYSSQLLSERSGKLIIFSNQQDVARKTYANFMGTITGICFLVITSVLLQIVYPQLLLVFWIYLFSAIAIIFILNHYHFFPLNTFSTPNKRSNIISLAGNIGFFSVFVFIVYQFLFMPTPPKLIYAIFGFILIRQALNITSTSASSVINQYEDRSKLNALFFQGHMQKDTYERKERSFWSLLQPEVRNKWVLDALHHIGEDEITNLKISWHQTRIKHFVTLLIDVDNHDNQSIKKYIVKLFSHSSGNRADTDLQLFQACNDFPALLDFAGEYWINNDFRCQIFRHDYTVGIKQQEANHFKKELSYLSASYDIPKDFCNRYVRTHPLIWQRINPEMIQRLRFLTDDPKHIENTKDFEERLDDIKNILKALPKSLVFFSDTPETMILTPSGFPKLIGWKEWRIEPIGFGWVTDDFEELKTMNLLQDLKSQRKSLSEVSPSIFVLSMLMAKFEKSFSSQNFNQALDILPQLIEFHIKILNAAGSESHLCQAWDF